VLRFQTSQTSDLIPHTSSLPKAAVAAVHTYEWVMVAVMIGLMILKPF
jgi:hypothetical protein